MNVELRVDGPEELLNSIQRFANEYPQVAAQALYDELRLVMNESQRQVPVDTGILRASGSVDVPMSEGGIITSSLGYSTNYAVYVHENLEAFHKPPTKAKFLEDPLYQAIDGMLERIASRLDIVWQESA
jgi:hypothetical protein